MIPTADLATLSETAKALYREAQRDLYRATSVSAEQMDGATELAETGWATLTISETSGANLRLEPKVKAFTAAVRADAAEHPHLTYIEVEVLRSPTDRNGSTLACLYGAEISDRSGQSSPWPRWEARVHHATARDSDHSGCMLADLAIDHPVLDTINGIETVLIGTLSDIRMWPTGTDITLIESNRKTPLDEPDMCTHCPKPHPYGPYMPEERDDLDAYLGRAVRVTITPIALVDANGQQIARERITRW